MDEVARYEQATTLTEPQKVLMRLHDAFLTHPAGLRPEIRAQALEHFSPAQIAETMFKFFWWSTNRATVTLGDDAPHDPTRLTAYHYTEEGEFVAPPRPSG
jgi:hypothetical protein